MGTWGPGPFDNDGASDLLATLENVDAQEWHSILLAAFAAVDDSPGPVDVDDGQAVIAAAAIVAKLLPPQMANLIDDPPEWFVEETVGPPHELMSAALRAIKLAAKSDSEIAGLWGDSQVQGDLFLVHLKDIEFRLKTDV
jgi:hypothetical protein